MIKNKSSVNQCGQIRAWRSGANTTHRRSRQIRVGCARPRLGDRRRRRRRTWTLALSSFRQRGRLQLLIPPIWQHWGVYSSEDRFDCHYFHLIRVFFRQATALRGRDSGVWRTSACNWAGGWSIQGSSSVSEIPKSLQICSSVCESAFVHDIVCDISGCGGAVCGNFAEHSICRVFCGNLRLTCVEMYNIFRRLD